MTTCAVCAPAAATTSPGSSSAPGCPRPSRRSRGRAATAPSATTCASRRSRSATATPPSATSSATTPPRPSATARAANNSSTGSRPSSPGSPSSARRAKHRQTSGKQHLRGECALRDHPTLSRYLRQTRRGLTLDRAKIAAEERLDGKYLLTTSDPTLSAEDVALGYKQLIEAERSFRDLKGTLLLRPVFHRRDDRIRAHVLICFLALVLVRLAETRTGETWRTIRAELGQIRQGHFQSADGEFTQTSELTPRQRTLHAALAVPEPPRLGRITPTATPQSA